MRILFHKLSDDRHRLAIERTPGAREEVECETRSYLVHDLLHYAVESEAGCGATFRVTIEETCTSRCHYFG